MDEKEVLERLERAVKRVRRSAGARKGEAIDPRQLSKWFEENRALIGSIIGWVEEVPGWGSKAAAVLRVLVTVADLVCKTA